MLGCKIMAIINISWLKTHPCNVKIKIIPTISTNLLLKKI